MTGQQTVVARQILLEKMIKGGVQPEGRTYAILVRAHISSNNAEVFVGFLGSLFCHPFVLISWLVPH